MRHDVSAADKFPCPRRKLSTGGVDALWTADMDKFRVRDESPSEGRLFGPQGRMRLTGVVGGRRGQVLRSGRNCPERRLSGFFAGSGRASVMAVVFTCNTYSAAYKGKDPKKRLSPKSPNTLIHSCITFYKTLIFQYLSLWKSVFSPD